MVVSACANLQWLGVAVTSVPLATMALAPQAVKVSPASLSLLFFSPHTAPTSALLPLLFSLLPLALLLPFSNSALDPILSALVTCSSLPFPDLLP